MIFATLDIPSVNVFAGRFRDSSSRGDGLDPPIFVCPVESVFACVPSGEIRQAVFACRAHLCGAAVTSFHHLNEPERDVVKYDDLDG